MNKILRILTVAISMTAIPAVSYAEPAEAHEAAAAISVPQPVIRVVGGHVEITLPGSEARTVVCYSLTGQVVKTLVVNPGTTTIDLPSGYYIIRCDRYSQRVIVR